ncbi:DUF998 domain-containing protein [Loigolactobacillus jiayinensis]|uniref:DUF998 domain-containing protein n=1 Tax=Loigolactobacillus jiayinensis TaxID=2486016 RepID=A0ABW1R8H2_9LACO|nr:DUF998 domain-containing protein [Loigolactobacillus jiayinensis]
MSNRVYSVKLPEAIADQLKLTDEQELKVTVANSGILLQAEPKSQNEQRIYVWAAVFAAISSLVFVGVLLNLKRYTIALVGTESIATAVIILGVVTGISLFTIYFVKNRHSSATSSAARIYWRNLPIIVLSFALILSLVLLGAFWLIGLLFEGASFDLGTATAILFAFNFVVNYFMVWSALSLDATRLMWLFTAVIISGVAISMATNGQQHWWQRNLSFLGTSHAISSWQFNLTLIGAALIMVALTDYLFVSLQSIYQHSRRLLVLRVILTAFALDLGAIGLFPNNPRFHVLHTRLAGYLVYFIILLIIGVRWLLPHITKEFTYFSYALGLILLGLEIAFQGIGYLSTTAFEMIAFVLAFSWIVMLLGRLQELAQGGKQVFFTHVKIG